MPLPAPFPDREPVHTRTITFKGYRRTDGLWDVEGHLLDVRPNDAIWPGGGRPANEPIHSMFLRLTVDNTALIVDAIASTAASPFEELCGQITTRYASLAGTRVGPGFRRNVQQLVGGLNGCTHMTELLVGMGTAVLQTLAGELPVPTDKKPFSLDGCHALDTYGGIVAKYYPKWFQHRAVPDPEKKEAMVVAKGLGQDLP